MDRKLINLALRRVPVKHDATFFLSAKEMLDQLTEFGLPDLIILDMMLPRESGLSILEKLRRSPLTKRVPIAIFTGLDCEKTEYKARNFGVLAYIQKESTEYNIASISRLLGMVKKGQL